ncbi:MAG: histidine phosphatase family protein, partial [Anaerolineae bacterium]|nr:histidine phosphatase family protein [Anaerolineae bacterium]
MQPLTGSTMRPTTLTLIRHGLTAWNAQGRAQGHAPVPLSEQGHEQARLLARALGGQPFAAIYSSDLLRCRQTAAPLAETLGLAIRFDERLREIDLGNWQGLGREEWRAYDPEHYAAVEADPVNVPYPGGENRPMLAARVMAGVRAIAAAHPGEHVLVITHGGPI